MTTRAQWQILATLTDEQVLLLSTCTADNLGNMRAWCADAGSMLLNGEPYPFDDPSFAEPMGAWAAAGTIVVNGVTVPAPVPVGYLGQYVYRAAPNAETCFVQLLTTSEAGQRSITRGTAHYTAANAVAHAEAMLIAGGA